MSDRGAMRSATEADERLIVALVRRSIVRHVEIELDTIQVTNHDDGGMGSLTLGSSSSMRTFGAQIADLTFTDSDGIDVSLTLNTDQGENLWEMDAFKPDFSALRSIPEEL